MPHKAVTATAEPKPRTPRGQRMTPEIGEVICLMYPDTTAREIAEFVGATRQSVKDFAKNRGVRALVRKRGLPTPPGTERTWGKRDYLVVKTASNPECNGRFVFAHVLAWEKHHRRKKPTDHMVVFIDGNKRNFAESNLHCLPRSEIHRWVRFIGAPIEVHLDRLWRKVMALDTCDAVKNKLLEQLETVLDPDKPLDIHRQRAVCETVQTLVNLLKVEVDYLRAIEGDGNIPFLETKHTEKARLKKLPRNPLLAGPALDHVWRGKPPNAN